MKTMKFILIIAISIITHPVFGFMDLNAEKFIYDDVKVLIVKKWDLKSKAGRNVQAQAELHETLEAEMKSKLTPVMETTTAKALAATLNRIHGTISGEGQGMAIASLAQALAGATETFVNGLSDVTPSVDLNFNIYVLPWSSRFTWPIEYGVGSSLGYLKSRIKNPLAVIASQNDNVIMFVDRSFGHKPTVEKLKNSHQTYRHTPVREFIQYSIKEYFQWRTVDIIKKTAPVFPGAIAFQVNWGPKKTSAQAQLLSVLPETIQALDQSTPMVFVKDLYTPAPTPMANLNNDKTSMFLVQSEAAKNAGETLKMSSVAISFGSLDLMSTYRMKMLDEFYLPLTVAETELCSNWMWDSRSRLFPALRSEDSYVGIEIDIKLRNIFIGFNSQATNPEDLVNVEHVDSVMNFPSLGSSFCNDIAFKGTADDSLTQEFDGKVDQQVKDVANQVEALFQDVQAARDSLLSFLSEIISSKTKSEE